MKDDPGGGVGNLAWRRLPSAGTDPGSDGLFDRAAIEQWLAALERDIGEHEVVEPLLAETLDVVAGQVIDCARAVVEHTVRPAVDHATDGIFEAAAVDRFAEERGTHAPLERLVPQSVEPLL